jgi:TolA-binding protein
MTCQEVREAFTDLYDGTLSGEPLADLNAHLRDCSTCRQEWATFRRTLGALGEVRNEEPPPGFAARVTARIEAPRWWQRVATALVFPLRVKLPVHAAALIVIGAMGLWMFQRSPEVQRAVDLAPPISTEQPTPAPVPEPSRDTPAPKLKGETPRPGPAPTSSGSRAAPAPPTAAEAEKAEKTEKGEAAPRLLQPTPAPAESRRRSELARPAAPDVPIAAKERGLAAPNPPGPAALLSDAEAAVAAREFDKAIGRLRLFLAQYPADERAPDARLLLADAYRAQRRYGEAIAEIEAFLGLYPADRNVPRVWYRRAEIRLESGDTAGCAMLREALGRYPDAPEAVSARGTLSDRCP